MNSNTHDLKIPKSRASRRETLLVDIMEQVGQRLLANRSAYQAEIHNSGTHTVIYSATQKVDLDITSFIKRQLDFYEKTRPDNVVLEDDDTKCHLYPNRVTWIGDAVDNTKTYLEGGDDFGSGLMAVGPKGKVLASLFLLPAKKRNYLAMPGKGCWFNENPMTLGPVGAEGPVAIVRWPRDRDQAGAAIGHIIETVAQDFRTDGYLVQPGHVLTAADILSLAENGPVEKILCYSKPWDYLIAAAIVHTIGAKAKWFDKSAGGFWGDVFPLGQELLKKAIQKERVLFRTER